MNAQAYSDDMKRDSFISGISSTFICERLLENQTLSFNQADEKACALELAKQTSETYFLHVVNLAQVQANRSVVDSDEPSEPSCSAAAVSPLVRVKYRISGLLCDIFVEVLIGTAVPSVQLGTRSVMIVARLVTTSNAA